MDFRVKNFTKEESSGVGSSVVNARIEKAVYKNVKTKNLVRSDKKEVGFLVYLHQKGA